MIVLKKYYNHIYKRLLIRINSQLRFLVLLFINFYKIFLSNYFGNNCRFVPSCSDYGKLAFQSQPFLKACWLTISRISRCYPGGPYGYDPVPPPRRECR